MGGLVVEAAFVDLVFCNWLFEEVFILLEVVISSVCFFVWGFFGSLYDAEVLGVLLQRLVNHACDDSFLLFADWIGVAPVCAGRTWCRLLAIVAALSLHIHLVDFVFVVASFTRWEFRSLVSFSAAIVPYLLPHLPNFELQILVAYFVQFFAFVFHFFICN